MLGPQARGLLQPRSMIGATRSPRRSLRRFGGARPGKGVGRWPRWQIYPDQTGAPELSLHPEREPDGGVLLEKSWKGMYLLVVSSVMWGVCDHYGGSAKPRVIRANRLKPSPPTASTTAVINAVCDSPRRQRCLYCAGEEWCRRFGIEEVHHAAHTPSHFCCHSTPETRPCDEICSHLMGALPVDYGKF
jgi:hypothetical protein